MELIVYSYLADLIFGDPQWFPHPVRLIGWLINLIDRKFNQVKHALFARLQGVFLTLVVLFVTVSAGYFLLYFAARIGWLAEKLVWVFLAYTTLAVKDLYQHAFWVRQRLVKQDLVGARQKLALTVGRDTENLTEKEVIAATLETVAESTNDGIVAPLFYLFLGGPLLALAYKAVNTLDSMVGHKDQRYQYFGWFSARLDDWLNYLPARLSGLLIMLIAGIFFRRWPSSISALINDAKKFSSPNSGYPQAALAFGLGVCLGNKRYYQGQPIDYPRIGCAEQEISLALINQAVFLSFLTSLVALILGVLVLWKI